MGRRPGNHDYMLAACLLRAAFGLQGQTADRARALFKITCRFKPVGKLPSLEKLDRINYRLPGWGFVLLSLAMVTGAIWAANAWGRFWSWEPRESWSLITWVLYAALLESRLTVGWRGRRAATLTIVVFAVLVGSFVGVSLLYPGKHGGSFG